MDADEFTWGVLTTSDFLLSMYPLRETIKQIFWYPKASLYYIIII